MKTTFTTFLILYLLNIQLSFAQDSIAISETGNWIISLQNSYGDVFYRYYSVENDSTINNVTYKVLTGRSLNRIGQNDFQITSPSTDVLVFRNDNSLRAYAIRNLSSNEELWYDFNLNLGDSLAEINNPFSYETFCISSSDTDNVIVASIDYTQYGSNNYKKYHFNTNSSSSLDFPDLIQHVGFDGLLTYGNGCWFEFGAYIITFSETPFYIQNNIIYAGTEDLSMDKVLSVYPNPAKDFLKINFPTQTKDTDILSIKDMTGKEVYRVSKFNIENNQIDFQLNTGSYLVEYLSDENYYRSKLIINQ